MHLFVVNSLGHFLTSVTESLYISVQSVHYIASLGMPGPMRSASGFIVFTEKFTLKEGSVSPKLHNGNCYTGLALPWYACGQCQVWNKRGDSGSEWEKL